MGFAIINDGGDDVLVRDGGALAHGGDAPEQRGVRDELEHGSKS